ncbi:hypothetical protein GCM10020331_055810 [Ectobacillus funiculus]
MPNIDPTVLTALINYDWPGNVRELRNVVERFILLNDEDVITLKHLPREVVTSSQSIHAGPIAIPSQDTLLYKERVSTNEEAFMIEEALRKTYGNKKCSSQVAWYI